MDTNQRESDLFWWADLRAAATVRVADGHCESVGRVSLRRFAQAKHGLDHVAHLAFACAAEAGNGLFHFTRGVLVDWKPARGSARDHNAADLSEGEADARILHVNETFDGDGVGSV